jgi:hypothetical protein
VTDQESTLDEVREVHDTDGIVIMDHMDCGAYRRYWNSMGVGPYTLPKEKERHYYFMAELSKLVKQDIAAVKPKFFAIQWLLPQPPDEKSGLGDPSTWFFKLS